MVVISSDTPLDVGEVVDLWVTDGNAVEHHQPVLVVAETTVDEHRAFCLAHGHGEDSRNQFAEYFYRVAMD